MNFEFIFILFILSVPYSIVSRLSLVSTNASSLADRFISEILHTIMLLQIACSNEPNGVKNDAAL